MLMALLTSPAFYALHPTPVCTKLDSPIACVSSLRLLDFAEHYTSPKVEERLQ